MANKYEIIIESILGGISDYENFGASDQFPFSCGVNPDRGTSGYGLGSKPSGYLEFSSYGVHATTSAFPMWLVTTPKNSEVYIYDAGGTIYSTTVKDNYATAITTLASSVGGGSAYYDNYVYFATNSTVARFGPLNQDSPAINADYWGNSLGKTTLSSTGYPFYTTTDPLGSAQYVDYPNHVMHRHSNGKLYFADVVGNQGVLHCISTTKTTVEGDTDSGSTYNAIDFPSGMYITSISSYGQDLAVALYEGVITQNTKQKARVAFWDTTNPDNYYQITSTEFPDTFISAMINSNGVLYVFSGPNPSTKIYEIGNEGWNLDYFYTRVSRFVGGYTFEQIAFIPNSIPPLQSGADGFLNKILATGSLNSFSFNSQKYGKIETHYSGAIYSIGSKVSGISKILNCITPSQVNEQHDTADPQFKPIGPIKYIVDGILDEGVFFGGTWIDSSSSWRYGIKSIGDSSYQNRDESNVQCFKSQVYRVGKPFKITKVTLPATEPGILESLNVTVECDGIEYTTNEILYDTYSNSLGKNPIRFQNANGVSSFQLCIYYYNDDASYDNTKRIALPIIIEYELLNNY